MKHKFSKKTLKSIGFYALIGIGLYVIPKSYKEWRATESKLEQISRGEDIGGFDTNQRIKVTAERVETWLKDAAQWQRSKTFCPPASDRRFWDLQEKPTKQAPEEFLTFAKDASPIVIIYEGTRQECYYSTGQWLPEIEKALKTINSKPWGAPDKHGKQYVDLKATTTARELSHCLAMLEDKLSPGIVLETKKQIRQRVIDPYRKELERYQVSEGYFGGSQCPWLGGYSNWSAVCITNIIYSSMVCDDIKEQAYLIAKSKEPIEDYLKTFEEDGSIASGIRYWDYGLGHLLMLGELLGYKTQGKLDLMSNPKLAKMVTFPLHTLIGKNNNQDLEFYPLFADNKNPTKTNNWVWEVIKTRFDIPDSNKLAQDKVIAPHEADGAVMDLLTHLSNAKKTANKIATDIKDTTSHYFPDSGLLISRFNQGAEAVAIAGGNNGTEHNHNDLGSYTFFSKDTSNYWLPMFGDMGDIEYTPKIFTAEGRYIVPLFSSYGHPVPVVDNHLQITGVKAAATVLSHKISDTKDEIKYDLIKAYNVPELESLTRTAKIYKIDPEGLEINDEFKAAYPINFETAIISAVKPSTPVYDEKTNTASISTEFNSERFVVNIPNADQIKINVERLNAANFNYNSLTSIETPPYRISLSLKKKAVVGNINYRINKVRYVNRPIESKAIPPRKED